MKKKTKIGIIGLGYVGLPLFVEFSKKYDVKGFDLSKEKIKQLLYKRDYTNQFSKKELNKISPNNISHNSNILKQPPRMLIRKSRALYFGLEESLKIRPRACAYSTVS